MESHIIQQGYLTKAPPLHKPRDTWRHRYFTLDQNFNVLRYYTNSKSCSKKPDDPRGTIDLVGVQRINKSSVVAQANKYNYGFELETGDRTWVFVPDSQEDMDKWITCLEKIVKQVNRTPLVEVDSPTPETKKKQSRKGTLFKKKTKGGKLTKPSSSVEPDSSSSSHGDEMSTFELEDEEQESLAHTKSISSYSRISSADSAIGSEKSSRVRLTDGLPKLQSSLSDPVSQRDWIIKENARDNHEKVTIPQSLLPSTTLFMKSQTLGSPTLPRSVDGVYVFEPAASPTCPETRTTEIYDSPTNLGIIAKQTETSSEEEEGEDPMSLYDTPTEYRKVETVVKKPSCAPDRDLYDIPSNVIKALQNKPKINLYDSLAPKNKDSSLTENRPSPEDIYDVPPPRRSASPRPTATSPRPTASSPRPLPSSPLIEPDSGVGTPPESFYDTPRRHAGSMSSQVSDTWSTRSDYSRHLTTSSIARSVSTVSSSRRTSQPTRDRVGSIESAYQMLVLEDPDGADSVYNTPPIRDTPPQPSCLIDLEVPSTPPRPVLPPRTDKQPVVPDRGDHNTLTRPRDPDHVTRPRDPAVPSRPVPLPPPEEVLVEIALPDNTPASVSTTTLTRAKINDHHSHRGPAPENQYVDVLPPPAQPEPVPERPPPLAPRNTMPARTPPRIPNRAGTIAAPSRSTTYHHNPFKEGYIPPPPSAASTLPSRGSGGLSTSPAKPGTLTLSKKAQDEFDAIPDTTPTHDQHHDPIVPDRPDPTPAVPSRPVPTLSIVNSGNSKYPTIKNNNIGMVKVKQGYQNVTEVKGALKSRGSAVKGERHSKLNRRETASPATTKDHPRMVPDRPGRSAHPKGYTPMISMEERMKLAEKQRYESMRTHEQRISTYSNTTPGYHGTSPGGHIAIPPHSLTFTGGPNLSQPSPVYVDAANLAFDPSEPEYVTSSQDIASLPEFIRMGEIDRSISQEDHAEYLSMDQVDMMIPEHEDYLAMDLHTSTLPNDDYLAMNNSTDQYHNISFNSNS